MGRDLGSIAHVNVGVIALKESVGAPDDVKFCLEFSFNRIKSNGHSKSAGPMIGIPDIFHIKLKYGLLDDIHLII